MVKDYHAPIHPYLRGAPPGLPFRWDIETLRGRNTIEEQLFGVTCRCASLPALIQMKRAAGRRKDNEAIAELEVLLEETRRQTPEP